MRISDNYGLIWPSAELYGEALRCFDAEAYLATCAMCRAAVEALLHIAKTRDGHRIQYDPKTRLTKLLEWADKEGLLAGLRSKANMIRDKGDLGVHLAQRMDREYKRGYDKFEMELKRTGSDQGSLVPSLADPVTSWVEKEEARQMIIDTCSIILQVTRRRWRGKARTTFSPIPFDSTGVLDES